MSELYNSVSQPASFSIAVTPSSRRPDSLEIHTFGSTAEFARALLARAEAPLERTEKDGPAFIPAHFAPPRQDGLYEGKALAPTEKPYRKGVNVREVVAFVVDVDGWRQADFTRWLDDLKRRDFHFLTYATHSYGKKPGAFFRVVFFLSRPVPIGSPGRWSRRMWPALMDVVGLSDRTKKAVDENCRDPARLFYLPSWDPKNPTPRPGPVYHPGQDLQVDEVLALALRLPYEAYLEPPEPSRSDPSIPGKPIDLVDLDRRLRHKFKKHSLLALFDLARKGRPLAPKGRNERHKAILEVCQALGNGDVAKDDENSRDLLEAFLGRSLNAMAADEPARDFYGEALRALDGARDPTKWAHWEALKKEQYEIEAREWEFLLDVVASADGGES